MLDKFHASIYERIPKGRTIREILGSINDPPSAPDTPLDNFPHYRITSDSDLDAFCRITDVKKPTLLLILHRDSQRGNTAPPENIPNPTTFYIDPLKFIEPEQYSDPIEDSEEEVYRRAKHGKKLIPKADHKFEERLQDIRRRIQRQMSLLKVMEIKHKGLFPNAIHKQDRGGHLCRYLWGNNNILTGRQAIQLRAAILAWNEKLNALLSDPNNANSPDECKVLADKWVRNEILGGNYGDFPPLIDE